ncbi:hypothetical protein [Plantactinospora sp. CA-290183]|uniref:hypothetical protein n=1 Tax=Plantactinospora sp. CA-290183 TaxID=3240006 RepID=UPI003D9078DB
MATFHQQGQYVHGPQYNADLIDLRGAALSTLAGGDTAELSARLTGLVDGLRHAAASGLLDPAAEPAVTAEVRAAVASLDRQDRAAAAQHLGRAVAALQVAAPVVALGAALVTAWNAFSVAAS